MFCYELKQAAIPLVAALPYHLHTYCIDFSSVRMETKMSPEGLKVLKFKKKKVVQNPIWPPVAGPVPGLAFKGLIFI